MQLKKTAVPHIFECWKGVHCKTVNERAKRAEERQKREEGLIAERDEAWQHIGLEMEVETVEPAGE